MGLIAATSTFSPHSCRS